MATTNAATRGRSSSPRPKRRRGSAAPLHLGVLWDYPFSIVRGLFFAFVGFLLLLCVGAYILSQPTNPIDIVLHLIPREY